MAEEDIRQIHTQVKKGEVAKYVLLPGDPGRVERIASFWDKSKKIASYREFVTYTGEVDGVAISATSTGIGGPSAGIVVEELSRVGAETFIRVGTSGCLGDHINPGDLVITQAAIKKDGTSKSYVGLEYPAFANYEIVAALVQAASELGYTFHVGVSLTVDGFYSANKLIQKNELKSMSTGGYIQSWMEKDMMDAKKTGALNQEMESATILTLSALFGLKAGAVCAVSDRVPWESPSGIDHMLSEEKSIKVAIEAVKLLDKWENKRNQKNLDHWHPGC